MIEDSELLTAVDRVARVPTLLVACDFDGTLAPIVENPMEAAPLPEAVTAIEGLAALPNTAVALISGRARRDLAVLTGLSTGVHLVGSHGSEFAAGFVDELTEERQKLLGDVERELETLVGDQPGVRLEVKPASIAVHVRTATRDVAQRVAEAVRGGPATWPEVVVTNGKEVIELSVITTHKGTALDTLRAQLSADAVVFVGDDVTDENAFAHLDASDVGVKVGSGDTRARYRVDTEEAAAGLLALLLETRRARDQHAHHVTDDHYGGG
jgi:trehalose-phosphatase